MTAAPDPVADAVAPHGADSRPGPPASPLPDRLPAAITADPALRRVLAALAPHRALIVGGAVRNGLIGAPVDDIDIATDARPDRVVALARAAGLRPVPTGIDHGTITVVAGGRGFEVTTFRRDVATDGRRAVVAFSDRIEDDAARRDFTINALYADAQGRVIDPVGGLDDLAARRLRFVGDADARITEDYLRILRFFRFHAWYGQPGAADPSALDACARHAGGLARISRERVTAELCKLLDAPDPAPAVALMAEAAVLEQVLPGADPARLAALVAAEPGRLPEPPGGTARGLRWPLRLAALGGDASALRLSRTEARVQDELRFGGPLAEAAYRLGAGRAAQLALLRAARGEALRADWRDRIDHAAGQRLPITAADLMPALHGPAVGRGLRAAEAAWIDSGFAMPAPALIDIALLAADD
ncbi:CCA tRNA nucleotidyltransferase [Paracoccus endophyticus]|uniref:CCA tRNA nucleotidyltransferase n=1 Tax=Paracoccus endophyticus TaxID=2233774 RepID=UPI000DD63D43|nr:CCA tRNA nucleotidyltransferase [Paracoccus endophyticus]